VLRDLPYPRLCSDLERAIPQESLQPPRLIPWCPHPDITLLVGGKGYGIAFSN